MNNSIVFWELASHDQEKSVQFFRDVFGWQISFDDKLGFYTVDQEGSCGGPLDGGIFTLRKAKLPFLTLYIQVEDIDKKAEEVTAAGGFIVEEPFRISERSKICIFNEPSGVAFGMIERISSDAPKT